jgi:hypothetical protein
MEEIICAKFIYLGIFRARLHYWKTSLRLVLLHYISVEVVLGPQLHTFISHH